MGIRLIDRDWERELSATDVGGSQDICIACPFIKHSTIARLLGPAAGPSVRVITRLSAADCVEGVSDTGALRWLMERGAKIRGVRHLHAKLYIFGNERAVIASTNLTESAVGRNAELGIAVEDAQFVAECARYFEALWQGASVDLSEGQLSELTTVVERYLTSCARTVRRPRLPDVGATLSQYWAPPMETPWVDNATQAFVKFLGEGTNRVPLSHTVLDEMRRSGCHWAVAYPASRRPSGVEEGAVMYIARITRDPNDIMVFGRAIAMKHVPGRDDATAADVSVRDWKARWSRYIRVHSGEFVAGTVGDGVSLNQLMQELQHNSFRPTQRNFLKGRGNIDPRKAYLQQAAVELSVEGREWLEARLNDAFEKHGTLSDSVMNSLDWPRIP